MQKEEINDRLLEAFRSLTDKELMVIGVSMNYYVNMENDIFYDKDYQELLKNLEKVLGDERGIREYKI